MPRPKTKEELLYLSEENFTKLFALIDAFDESQKQAIYLFDNDRDKNIRDIVMHLHHWHLMMQEWYEVGMRGDKPEMPAKGYTWKTTKALNQHIWQISQEKDFDEAVKLLKASFLKVRERIKSHTNEELFSKKRYKWTGTTSMGSYFVSATSSHYDWAMKLIRKYKKSLKEK
jgi:hypothetical protein